MQTIKLQLEDNLYESILNSGIDVQAKFKEFLFDLVDDGYPSITTEEAKKRVHEAVEDYQNNPQNFSKLDSDFWNDTQDYYKDIHNLYIYINSISTSIILDFIFIPFLFILYLLI